MNTPHAIASELQRVFTRRSLDYADLSQATGVTVGEIDRIFYGDGTMPLAAVLALAEALDVELVAMRRRFPAVQPEKREPITRVQRLLHNLHSQPPLPPPTQRDLDEEFFGDD